MEEFSFVAPLWRWQGESAWHFVTLPPDVSDDIEELTAPTRRGFGSVRVEVTVGETTWQTSLFPDSTVAAYVLPVRRAVRDAERLAVGDPVRVRIRLLDR
jgi:hypothetical protein